MLSSIFRPQREYHHANGSLDGAPPRPSLSSELRRWTRTVSIALPFVILINYLIIFHFSIIESLSRKVFPDESFHPLPYLQNAHEPQEEARKHGGQGSGQGKNKDGNHDYWLWNTTTDFLPSPGPSGSTPDIDFCSLFPTKLLSTIQVVLKVGAADHWTRTSSQVNAIIKCIPNTLIVSDRAHPYGVEGIFNATDILTPLPPSTYLTPPDLEIYTTQQNQSLADLRQGADGWHIDKYKFLPAVEYAVDRNPDAEWYVFIESDTYVFWDNMFRLLAKHDRDMPFYFGSPSPGRKYQSSTLDAFGRKKEKQVWFAYGGAGFVISAPAASRLVLRQRNALGVKGPQVTDEYKDDVRGDCCGDSVLGWAMHDKAGVEISGLFPMFNPMALHDMPFGKHYWCEPVISLHKSRAEDLIALWEWENGRDRSQGPLLYRDLLTYHPFFKANTEPDAEVALHVIQDWHNADKDGFHEDSAEHASNVSFEACAKYCHDHKECWQFTWHAHRCYMSKVLRLGQKKDPEGDHDEKDKKYISGWDTDKIQKFWKENNCEEGAHWVKPSIKRKF